MVEYFKYLAKLYGYPYLLRRKFGAEVQIAQKQLFHSWKQLAEAGRFPALNTCGFSVLSQFEEDGLLLAILAALPSQPEFFIEIGSNDGINSNCSNLALNHGWHGLFIDGNEKYQRIGKRFYSRCPTPWHYSPIFEKAFVTAANINELVTRNGFTGKVGLLSIDIDGNDYWIWKALTAVDPAMVVIETHVEFGLEPIVVPYDPHYVYPGKHPLYHGASPVAMTKLAHEKGYKLVGANKLGFNLVYVKREADVKNILPEVQVQDLIAHPSNRGNAAKFAAIKDWDFIRV